MSWRVTDVVTKASGYMITGIISYVPPTSEPSPYMEAPPVPRIWKNGENTVWCLTIDYRKPSLGDAGVLGTYRTYEGAIKALVEYAEDRYDRIPTNQEISDGAIYGCDEMLEIVKQQLEG